MRALIVDDSSAVRGMLRRLLTAAGYTTSVACNGQEALEHLNAEEGFDVALVDWNMPVMDGYTLLTTMRRDRSFDGTLVLMVTTESEIERIQQALSAGANEYLMKPFTADALIAKLSLLGLEAGA